MAWTTYDEPIAYDDASVPYDGRDMAVVTSTALLDEAADAARRSFDYVIDRIHKKKPDIPSVDQEPPIVVERHPEPEPVPAEAIDALIDLQLAKLRPAPQPVQEPEVTAPSWAVRQDLKTTPALMQAAAQRAALRNDDDEIMTIIAMLEEQEP